MDNITLSKQLSNLLNIANPAIRFEQYQTDVKTAVSFLNFINVHAGFNGKSVSDFGCGNGILGIGAALLGAQNVDLYDIDPRAIEVTETNLNRLGLLNCNAVVMDFFDVHKRYDMIISNPPFGIQTNFDLRSFVDKVILRSSAFFILYKHNGVAERIASEKSLDIYDLADIKLRKTAAFHTKEIKKFKVCVLFRL